MPIFVCLDVNFISSDIVISDLNKRNGVMPAQCGMNLLGTECPKGAFISSKFGRQFPIMHTFLRTHYSCRETKRTMFNNPIYANIRVVFVSKDLQSLRGGAGDDRRQMLLSIPVDANGKNDAVRAKLRHMHQEQVRLAREAAMMARRAALSAKARDSRNMASSQYQTFPGRENDGVEQDMRISVERHGGDEADSDDTGAVDDDSDGAARLANEDAGVLSKCEEKDDTGGMLLVPARRQHPWLEAAAAGSALNLTLVVKTGRGLLDEALGPTALEAMMRRQAMDRPVIDFKTCREIVVYSPLSMVVSDLEMACRHAESRSVRVGSLKCSERRLRGAPSLLLSLGTRSTPGPTPHAPRFGL